MKREVKTISRSFPVSLFVVEETRKGNEWKNIEILMVLWHYEKKRWEQKQTERDTKTWGRQEDCTRW